MKKDAVQPYPAYKDSGIPMIREVPAHWEVRRLKNWLIVNELVLSEATDPEYMFDYVDIGSVETGRLVRRPERIRFGSSPSRARRVVRPGDTIVSTVRTYLKAVWHAEQPGSDLIASTGFAVFTPRKDTFPKFVNYLCQSAPFTNRVTAESVGIAYPAIAETRLATFEVCVPPFAEQTAIARFLDHVDGRIRRYVRAKQKLIGVLEEQKQIVIKQAVTGQIDVRTGRPYSAYRDSNVVYLGVLPAHWSVAPFRRMAIDYCDGPFGSGLKSIHYTEDGIRVVRLQNIGRGEFIDSDAAYISSKHYSLLGDHSVLPGDILVAGLGDENHPAGRACVAPENIVSAMVKADCFRFRPDRDRVEPKFLSLQLTKTATAASAFLSTGATRQRTNLRSTATRYVAIPTMDEQTRIVGYVADETNGIVAAQESAAQQISFLLEYRARLIADVLTGKFDVRDAAAHLPDGESVRTEDDGGDSDDLIEAADMSQPAQVGVATEHASGEERRLDAQRHGDREKRA